MTPIVHWWRFSVVGILGFLLQMGALALFRRFCGARYLFASAAALEITLLHNFLWHRRYTWRDRRTASPLSQLVQFHLSNGLISLAGNLLIVRLLVSGAHLGLFIANTAAVLSCALANFLFANLWIFASLAPSNAPTLRAAGRCTELGGPTRT